MFQKEKQCSYLNISIINKVGFFFLRVLTARCLVVLLLFRSFELYSLQLFEANNFGKGRAYYHKFRWYKFVYNQNQCLFWEPTRMSIFNVPKLSDLVSEFFEDVMQLTVLAVLNVGQNGCCHIIGGYWRCRRSFQTQLFTHWLDSSRLLQHTVVLVTIICRWEIP